MKLRYPKWLKDLLLPFENPDHSLYADPAVMRQKEVEREQMQNLSDEEIFTDYEESDEELLEDILRAKSDHSSNLRNRTKE